MALSLHHPRQIIKTLVLVLLLLVCFVMAAATVVEKHTGSAEFVYHSWGFIALWALLTVSSVVYFVPRLRGRGLLLWLHLSFVGILLGAFSTHLWSEEGLCALRVGASSAQFVDSETRPHPLPCTLTLQRFEVRYYPGTTTAADYCSWLVTDTSDTLFLSMNHPATIAGYRLLPASYDSDLGGSVIHVSHDPIGRPLTLVSYASLFLAMLALLLHPREGFRRALRRLTVGLVLGCPALLSAAPKAPSAEEANALCHLYAYWNGRICPLQTVAHDFTRTLYGRTTVEGYNAEQVLAGWLFYPTTWMALPTTSAKGERAKEQEALKKMLLAGECTRLFPTPTGQWLSPADNLPMDMEQDEWFFVKKSMDYLGELIITHQHDRFLHTVDKIAKYQRQKGAAFLPSATQVSAERLYNTIGTVRPVAFCLLGVGLVFFFLLCMASHAPRRVLRVTAMALTVSALLYLVLLIALRGYVSRHAPFSNGFETMQCIAALSLLSTLWLGRRLPMAYAFGHIVAGLALLVATMGISQAAVTHLAPVLQSPLLSLHVCIIMMSYTLLALITLSAVAFFLTHRSGMTDPFTPLSRALLYPALCCLTAGIFLGAIWADVSWGRYWGWDPKEVWALITLLVYLPALHRTSCTWLQRPQAFHLYLLVAFLAVLMTYFGVNFLLGGLHSYAVNTVSYLPKLYA